MPHAAYTIASEGTLPAALALARSYLSAHPGHRFHVVAVGATPALARLDPRVRVVPAREIPVPRPGTFHHQYSPVEACAALKPYAAAWLLSTERLDGLVYLSPRTFVLRPLDAAWDALVDAGLVLAPRLGTAVEDRFPEATVAGCQGVFDMDFVGLRETPATHRLLDWWSRQVFVDCIDSPAEGLSLDRRSMDQAPWLFEGVHVLRERGFNLGAWNLHAHEVTLDRDRVLVDGTPLALFNFGGRDPSRPGMLGEGAAAVHLEEHAALAHLCARYDAALDDARRQLAGPVRDDPTRLANGIPMVRALSAVALQAARRRVRCPEPGLDPDGFCAFAATPDPAAAGAPVSPLVAALLALRPDVADAFPAAAHDPADAGFLAWLDRHGASEEGLGPFLDRFGERLRRPHPVSAALALHAGRPDLGRLAIFDDPAAHAAYAGWLAGPGATAEGLDPVVGAAFARTAGAVLRVLDAWFSDPARAADLPLLHTDAQVERMVRALAAGLSRLPRIDYGDVLFFAAAARARRAQLVLCWLRYNPVARAAIGGPPSVFRHRALREFLSAHDASGWWPHVAAALLGDGYVPARAQFDDFVATCQSVRAVFPGPVDDPATALERAHFVLDEYGMDDRQPGWAAWAAALLDEVASASPWSLNVCGPLRDASGVGEAARSLLRCIGDAGIAHSRAVLPGPGAGVGDPAGTTEADLYGLVDPAATANLVVANADARDTVDAWFGDQLRGDQAHIAMWMWETEQLPRRFRGAARGLDAILAPSRYAAGAIRSTVDVPVHVLPLAPDFAAVARAVADRARFGLPADAFTVGYFFDANSVLERKNPGAVLDAFRLAFGEDPAACLVLKVNAPPVADYDYEQLRARARGLNVAWVDRTLSRQDTFDLMASLDAYVSLHRAEGYGLTLAEAMALGKPCIATGYSGNLEFMDDSCALLVRHRVITTRRAHGAYPAGSRWAEPSVEDCAQHLRALRRDPAMRATLGEAARVHVRRVLDPAALGERLAGLCRDAAARGRVTAETP